MRLQSAAASWLQLQLQLTPWVELTKTPPKRHACSTCWAEVAATPNHCTNSSGHGGFSTRNRAAVLPYDHHSCHPQRQQPAVVRSKTRSVGQGAGETVACAFYIQGMLGSVLLESATQTILETKPTAEPPGGVLSLFWQGASLAPRAAQQALRKGPDGTR